MMNTFFRCRFSLANQSPGGVPPAAWQGPDLKISKTEFRNTPQRVLFQWFGKLQNECCTTDDSLQDLFAALLVNAANATSGVEVHRSFIEILSQITPLEACILNVIYLLPFDEARHAGITTDALPDSARILDDKEDVAKQPSDEIALALGNLVRVGCVKVPGTWGGGETFSSVNPTLLGREFVRACTTRQRKYQ